MPPVAPIVLVDAILDAFQESGSSGVLLSAVTKHPRKFAVQTSYGAAEIWVYVWTLTHGGRPSLPDEYRIQMTTVTSPLALNPNGYTLLLGYEPNIKMFAGFDLEKHRRFTTGSPSVQIDIKTLYQALQDGLAFDRKDNNEIAVGIRPDQLLHYTENAISLHKLGANAKTFNLLVKASSLQDIPDQELSTIPKARQMVVSTVNRLSRDASFRATVRTAYQNRCAVTRIQLRLVEAAHILPVGAYGSTDEVKNGLALSPTFHRAYDNGLIYLTEDYTMKINPEKENYLVQQNLNGGLSDFKSFLNKRIHLPPDRRQWPDGRYINKANEYRRIKP
jgi:putative restriction endonuclease